MLNKYLNYNALNMRCIMDKHGKPIKLGINEAYICIEESNSYFLSNYGNIIHRQIDGSYAKTPRIYSIKVDGGCVEVKMDNKRYRIVDLVAKYFLCPRDHDMIFYIDGNYKNCYYQNLMLITTEEYQMICDDNIEYYKCGKKKIPIFNKPQFYYPVWIYNRKKLNRLHYDVLDRCKKFNVLCCESWDKKNVNGIKNFSSWVYKNAPLDFGFTPELDKDVGSCETIPIYSPETCNFIPAKLNKAFKNSKKRVREVDGKFAIYDSVKKDYSVDKYDTFYEAKRAALETKVEFLKSLKESHKSLITEDLYTKLDKYINYLKNEIQSITEDVEEIEN